MAKLSSALSTPFKGASEALDIVLVDAENEEDREVLHLEVAVSSVSSLFLLQDSIERALDGVEDESQALEAFREALIDHLGDVVVSSDLEDDETGEIIAFTHDGLETYSTREVLKLFMLFAEALQNAPFVTAQAQRSKPGPKRGKRRKQR